MCFELLLRVPQKVSLTSWTLSLKNLKGKEVLKKKDISPASCTTLYINRHCVLDRYDIFFPYAGNIRLQTLVLVPLLKPSYCINAHYKKCVTFLLLSHVRSESKDE